MTATSKALLLATLLSLGTLPARADTTDDIISDDIQIEEDLQIEDDLLIASCVESCDECCVDCGCGAGVGGAGGLLSAFNLDIVYTGDTFSNTEGGISTGTNYGGLVDVVLFTDLAALGLEPIGGTFVLHGQDKHGPSLQRLVGATQSLNTDANPFVAMAEYYWQRPMFDDLITWRIGRQVGAIQFSVLDLASDLPTAPSRSRRTTRFPGIRIRPSPRPSRRN
jgi:hypothetical protein